MVESYPEDVTVDFVRQMQKPSEKLFCLLKDNQVMRFGAYRVKDYDSGNIYIHITEE